jgi:hypothetical protein
VIFRCVCLAESYGSICSSGSHTAQWVRRPQALLGVFSVGQGTNLTDRNVFWAMIGVDAAFIQPAHAIRGGFARPTPADGYFRVVTRRAAPRWTRKMSGSRMRSQPSHTPSSPRSRSRRQGGPPAPSRAPHNARCHAAARAREAALRGQAACRSAAREPLARTLPGNSRHARAASRSSRTRSQKLPLRRPLRRPRRPPCRLRRPRAGRP